jgi:hypothetical protein
MEEVIDIGSSSSNQTIKLNMSDDSPSESSGQKSVNFGMGMEMLMNSKKTESKNRGGDSSMSNNDLDALENDLKELTEDLNTPSASNVESSHPKPTFKLNTDETPSTESKVESIKLDDGGDSIIGRLTKSTTEKGTWDGFSKFSDVPVNPTMEPPKKELTREELMRKKFEILRKLETLRDKKGIKLSKNYTMESSLEEMEGEFEMLKAERERQASIKFQGNMMMMCVQGLEFLNKTFDPFDVDLDGWHDQVSENVDDYDEIFAELHEKYKSKASMAPELKLLFQLGGSALMVHMSNKMMSNLLPTSDDVLRQNPALMQQFMQASANSMKTQAPGFGSFMSGLMGGGNKGGESTPPRMPERPEMIPPNPSSRPRQEQGPQFTDADNMEYSEGRFAPDEPPRRSMPPPPRNDERSSKRPEMKGPVDIAELLGGLKTKKVEVSSKKDAGSTVSIDELKKMQTDLTKSSRSRRKPKSERNTISLNL